MALLAAGQASGDKTNDDLTLPGTGSTRATDLLQDRLPEQANGNNPVVLDAVPHISIEDDTFFKQRDAAAAAGEPAAGA